jgi:hypothetical protein
VAQFFSDRLFSFKHPPAPMLNARALAEKSADMPRRISLWPTLG